MKNLIRLAFLIILVTAMACQGPRDARSRRGATSDAFTDSTSPNNSNNGNGSGNGETIVVEDPGNGGGGTNTNLPTEIQQCQWSSDGSNGFAASSSHLGSYTFCQAAAPAPETDVYLQMKFPVTDSQICVIPTFNNGPNSIYIGEPRCLTVTDNKKIYKIGLVKNRPGYSNFAVTGAMIMKDKAFFYPAPFYQYVLSPDAYIFCSNFLDQYGDASYCNAFRSVGEYHYHQFPPR